MVRSLARFARSLPALLVLVGVLGLAGGPVRAAGGTVVLLPAIGTVDQVMAGYLDAGIRQAADEGAAAVVIELDTPGGSLDDMLDIVSSELEAPLPVIVWVAPAGGRAASAGTFITQAAHVALMAPGTSLGAASPVGGQGQDITGTEGQKVLNDAVAKMTAIVEERGRNVEWAVSTVTKAASASAQQALQLKAIDGIAQDIDAVLVLVEGRTVTVRGAPVTIHTAGASVQTLSLNALQGFLHLLSDPNIAFLLFTVGSYGLIFELIHPNLVTGALGALAIILAFIGFGSLPLNIAGLLLIALAAVLFLFETHVAAHGALAFGGLVCLLLGASALYTTPGNPAAPEVGVALPVMLVMLGLATAFVVGVFVLSRRIRRLGATPGTVGTALAMGALGEVRQPLGPFGSVYVGGEEWTARSGDGRALRRGTPVRVVAQEGLTIVVESADQAGSRA